MNKNSSISPVKYQPHKKVERLFFPRYGDPNLYAACGKKHFGPKPSYSTPYAANWGELEYMSERKPNSLTIDNYEQHQVMYQEPQTHKNSNYQHSHRDQQHYEKNRIISDVLDQQVHNFSSNKEKQNMNFYRPQVQIKYIPKRVQTQLNQERYKQPNNYYNPPEKARFQQSKTRTKTEQLIETNSRKIRFNPTFLSSINY